VESKAVEFGHGVMMELVEGELQAASSRYKHCLTAVMICRGVEAAVLGTRYLCRSVIRQETVLEISPVRCRTGRG
jgi:hypothetical protein